MTLVLPDNCTHQRLLAAVHEAKVADARDLEIVVRAEPGAFIHSSAIALLCCWGLLRIQHGCRFRFGGDPDTLRYLARMDLLRLLGAPYTEKFTRHEETGRFIALRLVEDREASLRAALEAIVALVEAQHADAAAFVPAMRWAVAEVLDNVGNHADSPVPGVVCAQYYPVQSRIDVAVCDMGRGIKASLATRYKSLYSHGDAVTKALQAGVTRDLRVGQGNGLTGCVEIIGANGGNMHIWTGDVDFAYVHGKRKGFEKVLPLPGTGVLLQLQTDRPVDLRSTTIGGGVPTSMHDVARQREPGEDRIEVASICAHTEGRSPARALREQVLAKVAAPEGKARPVTLDFGGVASASSSFLDELLGRLAAELGEERYQQLIGITNMADLLRAMADKVIQQRRSTAELEAIEAGEPARPGVPARVRLSRLASIDAIVLFGDHRMFDGLATAWSEQRKVGMHRIAMAPGWRSEVARVRSEIGERVALLVPGLDALGRDGMRQLGIEMQGQIGEHFVREWLAADTVVPCHALLPRQTAESARQGWFRQELWARDLVRSVAECNNSGGMAAGVHPQFQWSLIGLGPLRERETEHTVSFLDGAAILMSTDKESVLHKELERLRGPFGRECALGFRAVWEDDEHPLTSRWHSPRLREAMASLEDRGGTSPLAELLEELRAGIHPVALHLQPDENGPVRVITGRSLGAGLERLAPRDLDGYAGEVAAAPLQGGEILVAAMATGRLHAGVVPTELRGAHAHHTVFVLSPKDQRSRELLADYLRSDLALDWLRVRCGSGEILRVTAASLQDLPVPKWENDLVATVEDLRAASGALDACRRRFDSARREMFSIKSLNERLVHIQKAASEAQIMRQFVDSIDDLAANIRRTLPLPLAEGWRAFEAECDDGRRYAAGLVLFEGAMVYVGLMLLADLRADSRSMSRVDDILECYRTPERGPGLGQWLELQSQSPKLTPERAMEVSAFPELRLLIGRPPEDPYWAAVERLKQRRNDQAHGRGPKSDGELRTAVVASRPDLEVVFGQLLFLARYPLRVVESMDYDALENLRTIDYRDLVGDHPIVPRRRLATVEEVGRGLHVVDQHGKMRLISPWLIYEECPECKHREVCAPEYGAPRKDKVPCVYYKSLVTGHMHPGRLGDWQRLARFVGRVGDDAQ